MTTDETPGPGRPRSVELRDARALRALAHPTRLKLVGLLRLQGPLTATQAARELGETPQRCTFHLGQLAKYGLVEEAGGGRGRERPWRATAFFTSWPNVMTEQEAATAGQLLEAVVAEQHFEDVMGWIERKDEEPQEWQEAAQLNDVALYLTAAELEEMGRAIWSLFEPYLARAERAELAAGGRSPGHHPEPGLPAAEAEGGGRRLTAAPPPARSHHEGALPSHSRAPPRAPAVPPLLDGADGVADRRPGDVHRAAAGRRARAGRERRADGLSDGRGAHPQPAVLAARRGVRGPPRPPPAADDPGRRGTRPAAGARPPDRRPRAAVAAGAVRGRVPHRQPQRALHGRVQRAVRGAGAQGRLRGRAVAAQRQPRGGRRGGAEPRRDARAGAHGAAGDRRGRRVLRRLGGVPAAGQGRRAAARGGAPRSAAERRALHRLVADRPPGAAAPRPRSTSSTTRSWRCSSCTPRAPWGWRRARSAWCWAPAPWAR